MIINDPTQSAPAEPERVATPPSVPAGKEKVRGMYASLGAAAAGNGEGPGPLKERDPGRLHITRRQIAFAVALAALAVIAAIYTVDSISSGQSTYPAVVTTSKVYDLNFASNGKVTAILAKVGQHVVAGQPLARQDVSALQSQLAAQEAVVKADQEAEAQAAAPTLSSAQREQDALQVQQAQTAVTNAQSGLSSAEASGKANVAGAEATATAAQALASTDQSRYQSACPSGPVPPVASLTGAALQSAEAAFNECQSLQSQLDRDVAANTDAQAQVPVVQAQSQDAINQAQATLNSAETALQTAQYQETFQSSANNPTALAQARANLGSAQQQLVVLQKAIQQATLVAPGSGVVAEVYGAVGEYLGPSGVQQYQNPAALQQNSPANINLFPTQTVAGGANSSTGGLEPLVEIVGGQQQVMAQVPESHVGKLPVGHTATVAVSALGVTTTGVVTEVVLNPTRTSSVSYQVVVTLNRTLPGLLPGMSATVRS